MSASYKFEFPIIAAGTRNLKPKFKIIKLFSDKVLLRKNLIKNSKVIRNKS